MGTLGPAASLDGNVALVATEFLHEETVVFFAVRCRLHRIGSSNASSAKRVKVLRPKTAALNDQRCHFQQHKKVGAALSKRLRVTVQLRW